MREKNPSWGHSAPAILEEGEIISHLRLPLYLIIHSLNFRNRIAHVVLMAKKERVCSEIKLDGGRLWMCWWYINGQDIGHFPLSLFLEDWYCFFIYRCTEKALLPLSCCAASSVKTARKIRILSVFPKVWMLFRVLETRRHNPWPFTPTQTPVHKLPRTLRGVICALRSLLTLQASVNTAAAAGMKTRCNVFTATVWISIPPLCTQLT